MGEISEKGPGPSRRTKWTVLAAIVLFVAVMIGIYWGSRAYVIHRAEDDIQTMLLQHKGVHEYVQRLAHPELYSLKKDDAIPEELYSPVLFSSSYMVRNMHGFYNEEREKAGLPCLYYKMAAENPRNPVNKANEFEAGLIAKFNKDSKLKDFRKVVEVDGQEYLYVAIPFLRNEKRCLKCHGKPEDAPKQLQLRYPGEGGYGEKVGYIRAIESLRAPLKGELAAPYIVLLSGLIVGSAITFLVFLNQRLRKLVTARTNVIIGQTRIIRESEENLRITLNSIGDAVIASDTEGRVVRMNPVAESLTGWTQHEAQGQTLDDVFHIVNAHTREKCESPVEKVMRTGEVVGLANHTLLISRDGVERQIADSGAPILADSGETVGVVLVFRDVTEQHLMESRLQQSQKMDAIGRLAGGIAHDFNNMLGGIIGSSELLTERLKGDETYSQFAKIILDSSERAAELTNKLLTFARKGNLGSSVVDVHRAVDDAVALLSHTLDKRIVISTDLAASSSTVIGDMAQLQNVFLNLGINAGDAMPDGGTLSYSSRVVDLDPAFCAASAFDIKPGSYIMVEVRDTGVGIPADILHQIFEPFFTTKTVGKGTGLGLATAFGVVKQHKGSLTVYSEVGKGTVFHVALPLSDSEVQDELGSEPVHGSGCILVVDDEEGIRATARGILTSLGYEVVTVCNGREALEAYEKRHDEIDLVLLDMVMPEMNGEECFRKLRELDPSLPIILSSGFSDGVDVDEMKAQGLRAFIRKPYRSVNLSRVVADVLQEKEASSEAQSKPTTDDPQSPSAPSPTGESTSPRS